MFILANAATSIEVARSPYGRWQGEIAAPQGSLAIVVDIGKLPDGTWVAEMDIPTQNASDYGLMIQVNGNKVELLLPLGSDEENAQLVGSISKNGAHFSGLVYQDGNEIAFDLIRVGRPQISTARATVETARPDTTALHSLGDDAAELKTLFNNNSDKLRLILLLSPS